MATPRGLISLLQPFPGVICTQGKSMSSALQTRAKASAEAEPGLPERCWASGALQPAGTWSWEFFEEPGFGQSGIGALKSKGEAACAGVQGEIVPWGIIHSSAAGAELLKDGEGPKSVLTADFFPPFTADFEWLTNKVLGNVLYFNYGYVSVVFASGDT